MKAMKEDEKIMGPMFPRLHVNDTADKGGPRAPPRNKMALYEQLSIPSSQRFASAAASPLRLPQRTSASSTQGGLERTISSPYYLTPHAPRNSGEKVHNLSSDGGKASRMGSEKRSAKQIDHKSMPGAGPVVECSSPFARESFKVRSSSVGRRDDEDDFRVPTLFQSKGAAQLNKDRTSVEAEPLIHIHADTPRKSYSAAVDNQPYSSFDKTSEHTNDYNKTSTKEVKDVFVRTAATLLKENKAKSPSDSETLEKSAESSSPCNASLVQESMQAVNNYGNSEQIIGDLLEDECREKGLCGPRCPGGKDLGESGDVVVVGKETCPKTSHGVNCQPAISNMNHKSNTKTGSLRSKYANKRDEVSEASMVVSLLGLEISPDDVVGVIGPKQFWKARRAIVNQQRVFAVQVFELHRVIKVQKLIAASPHLLLEGHPSLDKSVPKEPTKHLSSKSYPPSIEGKDDVQKQSKNTDLNVDNIIPAPLASNEDILNKGHGQAPRSGTYSGNPPPTPFMHENNPSPWLFHQPANQWLVPVMSPSEGLIYKPCSGPCPPGTGFVPQVYGSGPPPYGVPTSHQQQNMGFFPGAPAIPPSYFPTPYGLPVVNPGISASGVELVNSMVGFRPNCQIDQNSRSSCNMPNSKTDAFSACLRSFQASKGSEIQGSTASCPCDKTRREERDTLPLTPIAPAAEDSARPSESHDKDNNQTRVIKVVPHNARSAPEFAARIFRSIQKERQAV